MIPHPFGVVGLVLNAAGAIGLLKYVADPDADAPLPHDTMESVRLMPGMERERWKYRNKIAAYRWSYSAMIIGFVLQLADLLTT